MDQHVFQMLLQWVLEVKIVQHIYIIYRNQDSNTSILYVFVIQNKQTIQNWTYEIYEICLQSFLLFHSTKIHKQFQKYGRITQVRM